MYPLTNECITLSYFVISHWLISTVRFRGELGAPACLCASAMLHAYSVTTADAPQSLLAFRNFSGRGSVPCAPRPNAVLQPVSHHDQ